MSEMFSKNTTVYHDVKTGQEPYVQTSNEKRVATEAENTGK